MAALPVGTLTFVLTDLEGSTRTWETHTDAMRSAMVQHDALVYGAIERNSGASVESGREGDSILAVFTGAREAAACALDVQRGFRAAAWPGDLRLRTRIAVHTGEVELRGGHYFGPPLNRCARVLALAHGGQTLVTQATRELLEEDAPLDVELTDLGVHRLKDLRRSERIFQLTDRTHPEKFPPLHARSAYRTNLPILLTSFVGREEELRELRGLLAKARLVTLTGPGGGGKTRLAKQLALDTAADLSGGAWFVDLAPISDGDLVVRAVATAVDIEEQLGRPLVETLVDHCVERPMLLVLDNCEHLLPACAEVVERLLASCPELCVLATSREPLNVGGEVTFRVPGLAIPQAARLFVERARTRTPSLELSGQAMDTVAEICRRLDGMPLAIELAAARSAAMSPDEIRRRLDSGLRVLRGGERTAAKRQQALTDTIDWSHELLSESERVLFRRLAVFAGSFSLDAAEAICDSVELPRDAVLDHLGQLVAKSLVQPIDDRYGLLQTIRAYASEKLRLAREDAALSARHAEYYLRLLRSRVPGAFAAWLEMVAEEHDNLRAAFAWSVTNDVRTAADIATAMYDYWLGRGYALEARAFLGQVASRLAEGSTQRARVLLEAGVFAYTAGDFAAAPSLIASGLALAHAGDDRTLVGRGLVFQGGVATAAGQVETAQRALDEALAIARETGGSRLEAETLHHLGVLASVRGDIAHARSLFTESIESRRRLGITDEANNTLTLRAFLEILMSELEQARADILEAVDLALRLRDRRAAWSLDVLACLTALGGDAQRALRLAGAAQAVFEATAVHPPAVWRHSVEPLMERARAQLGPEAAAAATAAGRALTFEQALHYALSEVRPSGRSVRVVP